MPYLITPRILGLTLHFYIIKIAQYYPAAQTCEYHGPIIVVLQLTSLLWVTKHTPETFPMHLMVSSFTGIFITMIYGLICSACWYLTTSSIVFISVVALSYYNHIYHFNDIRSNFVLSVTILMLSFFIYTIEKKEKLQFLNYQQI